MSNNSSVTVKGKDGKFKSVYCNFDGDIDGVGKTLINHYNSQELAEQIVNLGDSNPDKSLVENTYQECMKNNNQKYNYLWQDGEWLIDGELLYVLVMRKDGVFPGE